MCESKVPNGQAMKTQRQIKFSPHFLPSAWKCKRTLSNLIIALAVFSCAYANAQNINTEENFPDANFRAAVAAFMNVGLTDPFTAAQAAAKTGTLNVSSSSIGSVSGIQFFTGITAFYCQSNLLSELDITQNTNLQYLFCSGNQLTGLDSSNNPNLRFLYCYDNALTSLDLSENSALTHLQCQRNDIADLVVSPTASLINVNAFMNQLTDVASLAGNPNWSTSTVIVDVRYNDLDCASWDDIQLLQQQLGGTFLYSPQNGLNPFECADNINTPENFPDLNFRTAVATYMGVGLNDPFTAADAAAKTGSLNASGANIASVSGIEYFTGLTGFYCRYNQLTSLDVSQNTSLQYLFCNGNQLTQLTVPANGNLRYLYCYDNDLTSLDVSNVDTLTHLQCQRNDLTELLVSPSASLINVNAFTNQLSDVTSLAANINWSTSTIIVDVRYNNLDCTDWDDIQLLEQQLGGVFLYSPQNGIDTFDCADNINTVENFPDSNFRSAVTSLLGVGLTEPFTADEAASVTGTFNASGLNISSVSGIEFLTGITAFYCRNNQLTSLDVSQNTNLQYLFCNGNQIQDLNVSGNAVLRYLYCYDNALTSLDLSANDAITHLQCQRNALQSLVVSQTAAFQYINAFTNQLTDIASIAANVNWHPGIGILDVRYNNLDCSDWDDISSLEQSIGSKFLYSPQNEVDPFDCEDNINTAAYFPDLNFRTKIAAFMGVGLNDPFTASDAAAKTGTLSVSGSNISSVSGIQFFPNITSFYCRDNQLTELDISQNVNLLYLFCERNQLSSLDVSNNTNLRYLYCMDNNLTELDLSNNPALTHLQCQRNQLSSLIVSPDALFKYFSCFTNNLMDISSLAANSNWAASAISVDIRYNYLACNDQADIALLESQIGTGFYYDPQKPCPGPEIDTPADLLVEADALGGASVNFDLPSATGTCNLVLSVTSDPVPGSFFALGSTIVGCTATDECGQVGYSTFTVTVQDTTPPEIAPADNLQVECTQIGGAIVTFAAPVASDIADPAPAVSCVPSSGDFFGLGDTIVQCTAQDASGNISGSSFTVTVVDTTPPVISLIGPGSLSLECKVDSYAEQGANAVDICDGTSPANVGGDIVDVNQLGDYEIVYTASDAAGNIALPVTRTVSVVDTLPPDFDSLSDVLAEAEGPQGAYVSYATPTVTDLCDSLPTVICVPPSGSLFAFGATVVECTATDFSGNIAAGTFTVSVTDTTPPVITPPGNLEAECSQPGGAIVAFDDPIVTDLVDPAPSITCYPPSGAFFPLGDTVVQCMSGDVNGNVSSASFTVSVVDTTPPVIALNGDAEIALECNVDTYTEQGAVASDICDVTAPVTIGGDTVNTGTVGTYIVTYNAIDAAGNSAQQATRTVYVIDTLAPVLSGLIDVIQAQDTGCAENTAVSLSVVVQDLADPNPAVSSTFNYADGSSLTRPGVPYAIEEFPIGTNIVSVSSTDFSGNSTSDSFSVDIASSTILDVTALTFSFGTRSLTPITDAPIRVFDSSVGSCADLADGVSGNGVSYLFFEDIFLNCDPAYSGVTNAQGNALIGVLPGQYVAVLGIDSDVDGDLDTNDKYIGVQIFNLGCGDIRIVYMVNVEFSFSKMAVAMLDSPTITTAELSLPSPDFDTTGADNITVPSARTVTLQPGIYGDVVLGNGGRTQATILRLSGNGCYDFRSLQLGRNCRVEVMTPCDIRIEETLITGSGCYIGPASGYNLTASDIQVFVKNGGASPYAEPVDFGVSTQARAYFNSPSGTIRFRNNCVGTGLFVASGFNIANGSILTFE